MITKKDAKEFAKKHRKDGVIVFYFDFNQRIEFGYASYGKDKNHCDSTKAIADEIFDKIMNGEIKTLKCFKR